MTHARDIRSGLLVKLALLDRAGLGSRELVLAQRQQLAPIAGALTDRLEKAAGFDRTVALWRHETITAAVGSWTRWCWTAADRRRPANVGLLTREC